MNSSQKPPENLESDSVESPQETKMKRSTEKILEELDAKMDTLTANGKMEKLHLALLKTKQQSTQ